MAVLTRPGRAMSTQDEASAARTPDVYASTSVRERLGNAAPIIGSLILASSVFWAPLHATTAGIYAVCMLAFYAYWVVRSYGVAVACVVGTRRLARWRHIDWHAKYAGWANGRAGAPAWEWPRHLVVIPNYREAETELRRTIDSLARQPNARQIVVVLAMEAREAGAEGKAARLMLAYRDAFEDIVATFHPAGLPGETPGKGSNEAWALRKAYERRIVTGGDNLARYTVTSCDADAVFGPQHFMALNYLFLAEADRYRTFWQPTIFNSNNIWEIPAPLRMLDGLSGVNRLANLTMPGSLKFPTSCYSLSWQMLREVDHWDEEVIPEDWHLYLKCCFSLGDRVHVVPMYLELGNDCVLTDGTARTMRAHYFQAVRHAWGASDIPYAWRATWRRGPLSIGRRLLLAFTVTKVHLLWMAQWYLVTLGMIVPVNLAKHFGAPMPHWWTDRVLYVPGVTWHFNLLLQPDRWFGSPGLLEPMMRLNPPGALVAVCILPLFVLVATEYRARGPRPDYVSRFTAIRSFFMWPLMAPITFVFASMPAVHAQWRLGAGRGLVYRVAEKGSRADQRARRTIDDVLPVAALQAAMPGEYLQARRIESAANAEAGAVSATVFFG